MSNVQTPITNSKIVTVPTSAAATISIAAILGVILYLLQTFGVITPNQAATAKQITDQVSPLLQNVLDSIDKKLATTPPAPKTDPTSPTPLQPTPAELLAEIAKAAEQIQALQGLIKNPPPAPLPVIDPTKPINVPVTPNAPTATIVTQDAKGKPLPVDTSKQFSTSEPSKQFLMMSTGTIHAGKATSLKWVLLKSSEEDIDASPIPSADGNGSDAGYAVTMRNNSILTVTLSATQNDVVSATSLIVKCGQGAQPPPVPVTVVPVNPAPIQQIPIVNPPASSEMRVIIVYNSLQNHTKDQLTVLNSTKFATALDAKCVKNASGTGSSWRRLDKDLDASKEKDPAMKALWIKVLPEANDIGLPAIAVACGDTVKVKPLPTNEADAIALLTCGG